ncbi:nucleoside/nucleotide kinase family protein [Larsenimonas salina]|uniref:nucleoside/nucleotide kinase family protein n=1 Tax=Larsenimonas salina TaxID=1295565 RepID=UPI0020730688|nr:nucleoside/nucleotide kinase family protein [Larsenimonas salina]MCM5704597.1 nucleoside/nucleotide kinase family protein [Larsenimonas salina]
MIGKHSENDTQNVTVDPAVLDAARALADRPGRTLLGIVGAPGAGKSTLTEALITALGSAQAQCVPMDGYHLSNRELARLGRSDRKGAPDTFDATGYRDLLTRIRKTTDEVIYAPAFYREIEEPIAASLVVTPECPLVITEGNYLLLEDTPWPQVAAQLDEVWYVDVPTPLRETWLVERHMRFGRTETEARDWVATTDRPNAERIEATRTRAHRTLVFDGPRLRFA